MKIIIDKQVPKNLKVKFANKSSISQGQHTMNRYSNTGIPGRKNFSRFFQNLVKFQISFWENKIFFPKMCIISVGKFK